MTTLCDHPPATPRRVEMTRDDARALLINRGWMLRTIELLLRTEWNDRTQRPVPHRGPFHVGTSGGYEALLISLTD